MESYFIFLDMKIKYIQSNAVHKGEVKEEEVWNKQGCETKAETQLENVDDKVRVL